MNATLLLRAALAALLAGSSAASADDGGEGGQPPPAADAHAAPGRSAYGGEGLVHVGSAQVRRNVLTFSAHGGFFRQAGVTGPGVDQYHLTLVGAAFAPTDWLELAATSRSASLDQPAAQERLTFLVGDLWLRAKAGKAFGSGVSLAAEAALRWPPPVLLSSAGLSPQLGALATWDGAGRGVPLRLHLNAGFVWDNSYQFDGPQPDRSRRYAVDINTYNRVTAGAAVEGQLRIGGVGLRPFVEYTLDVPLQDRPDVGQAPMRLIPGLRLTPWRGLFVDGAVELGLVRPDTAGVAPVPGWMAVVAVGYGGRVDPRMTTETRVRTVDRVETVVAPPTTGTVRGSVVDRASGKPVADAVVTVPGAGRLLSSGEGTFRAAAVAPGPHTVRVERAGYAPEELAIDVVAGDEAFVQIDVAALPPPPPAPAVLRGTVVSEKGNPLPATVTIKSAGVGPQAFDSGEYELAVPEGEHQVEVTAPGHLRQGRLLKVRAGEAVFVDFLMREAPKKVLVVLRREKIEIRQQVNFAVNRDVILASSAPLLDQVAAAILDNPQIRLLRVEGHTDSQGDDGYNLDLSQRRAASVVRALLERGVAYERLKPVGFGETAPIANNKAAAGRAKNRRVELMIEVQD